MITITRDMISKACPAQIKIFSEIFPDGAIPSEENAIKAAKAGLNINWAAQNLLSSDKYKDYLAKRKSLYKDYEAKRESLDEDHWAKRKLLDDDYYAKLKPLWDDYRAKLKPLDEDYEVKRALLFVEIWNR